MLLDHYRAFASYNFRFNRQLYDIVGQLDPADRERDLGAFFGSIEATLNHIMVGDHIWLSRFRRAGEFAALEEADLQMGIQTLRHEMASSFETLRERRVATDQVIMAWVDELDEEILARPFEYAMTNGKVRSHPLWIAVSHLFNHQTHHRGQVTTLLSQLGREPGTTDFLMFALA